MILLTLLDIDGAKERKYRPPGLRGKSTQHSPLITRQFANLLLTTSFQSPIPNTHSLMPGPWSLVPHLLPIAHSLVPGPWCLMPLYCPYVPLLFPSLFLRSSGMFPLCNHQKTDIGFPSGKLTRIFTHFN